MSKTNKIKLTLEPGEAAVVGPIEFWNHLTETYTELANRAETNEEKQYWIEAVDFVRLSVENTLFVPEEDSDDWQ